MSRCLSNRSLEQLAAGLGTPADEKHLAACDRCASRRRRLARDLELITQVLGTTAAPRARPAHRVPRWMPIVGLATAAAAALFWIEVTVWRAVETPPMPPDEAAMLLSDVSSALFSVTGVSAGISTLPIPGLGVPEPAEAGSLEDECTGMEALLSGRCSERLADGDAG